MNGIGPLDLVMLVPGRDDREIIEGLLTARRESLGIRAIRHQTLVHIRHDPGCFREAPELLRSFQLRADHALVMLDYEGSGQEARRPVAVAEDLKSRLAASGWGDRADVLLLRPELETWIWSDSPHVDAALGWAQHSPPLRTWLAEKGFWPQAQLKPPRPKESLIAALLEVRVQRSSAIFRLLAEQVSLERCQDEVFARLKDLLRSWFPIETPA